MGLSVPFGAIDPEVISELADLAWTEKLQRVSVLSWRDVADNDAGGSEIFAAQVARYWASAGIDVHLRTSAARGLPECEIRDGYSVKRKSSRQMVFPSTIVEQIAQRKQPNEAVLEIWNGVPYFSPIWCRKRKVVFIHHVHRDTWDLTLSRYQARFGKFLEGRIAPPFYRRTRILTPSEASKDEIVRYLGLPVENIRVVEPGVDPRFTPGPGRSPEPTILAVGRLVPYKRFEDLVGLMPRILDRIPTARLVIIGDGFHRSAIEDAIRQHHVEHCVELRGQVSDDDLISAYRESWVLTSASVAEGWGMTITEAGACGTPSVVRRVGGHVNAVADGVSGLLAHTSEDLFEGIVRVLGDERERSVLSDGAHKFSSSRSWGNVATAIFRELAFGSR